jgi:hypothetical protein
MAEPFVSEREQYDARVRLYEVWSKAIDTARREGREEGLERGQSLGRIHLCQRLLKVALTPREELLTLPLVELRFRADTLEQQLGARGS